MKMERLISDEKIENSNLWGGSRWTLSFPGQRCLCKWPVSDNNEYFLGRRGNGFGNRDIRKQY